MFAHRGMQYKARAKLGEGVFGKVYLVTDPQGRKMCIKTVQLRDCSTEQRKAAKHEVDILQRSESNRGHANVIRYYGSWFRGAELCILMEYAPNGTLEQFVRAAKTSGVHIPEMDIQHKLMQLLSALDYCHTKLKVIHRDIKPANILLDQMGRIKLADFGISKQLHEFNMLAATQAGTPLYMPPEMMSGHRYTFKVDVWMLGCVLYEMMAFCSPWLGERAPTSMEALARCICNQNVDTSRLRKHYSSQLCRTAHWMLARDPHARPSMRDVLDLFAPRAPPARSNDLYKTVSRDAPPADVADQLEASFKAVRNLQSSFRRLREQRRLVLEAQKLAGRALAAPPALFERDRPAAPAPAPPPCHMVDVTEAEEDLPAAGPAPTPIYLSPPYAPVAPPAAYHDPRAAAAAAAYPYAAPAAYAGAEPWRVAPTAPAPLPSPALPALDAPSRLPPVPGAARGEAEPGDGAALARSAKQIQNAFRNTLTRRRQRKTPAPPSYQGLAVVRKAREAAAAQEAAARGRTPTAAARVPPTYNPRRLEQLATPRYAPAELSSAARRRSGPVSGASTPRRVWS